MAGWLRGLDLDFVTYSTRRGWKPGSGLPSRQAEQAGLAITSGGGALRHRGGNPPSSRIVTRCSTLAAAATCSRRRCKSSRQRKRLPSMSMNFGAGISLLLPFGVSAQRCAAPLPVGETGGSKRKGGGQGGGSSGLHNPGRRSGGGRSGIPWLARGHSPRSLPGARDSVPWMTCEGKGSPRPYYIKGRPGGAQRQPAARLITPMSTLLRMPIRSASEPIAMPPDPVPIQVHAPTSAIHRARRPV